MPRKRTRIEDYLINLPLFKQLDSEEISRIAEGATEIDTPRGSILFRRGDPCIGFHIVIFGQVKLALQAPQGGEKVVDLMGPGQSFGEAEMFLGRPYLMNAETLVDSKLLHVAKETVLAELELDPEFARHVIADLCYRLHHLVTDLESVSLRSGTQRVIGYFVSRLQENGGDNSFTITLPASKSVIASWLNLTQAHFSRILHELSAEELISVKGRKIKIPDVSRLLGHVS